MSQPVFHPSAFILHPCVAQQGEQFLKFVCTTMNVTNDVKRSMLGSLVVPQRNSLDGNGFNILRLFQYKDVQEAFSLEILQRLPKL